MLKLLWAQCSAGGEPMSVVVANDGNQTLGTRKGNWGGPLGWWKFLWADFEEFQFLCWQATEVDDVPAGDVLGEGVSEALRGYD